MRVGGYRAHEEQASGRSGAETVNDGLRTSQGAGQDEDFKAGRGSPRRAQGEEILQEGIPGLGGWARAFPITRSIDTDNHLAALLQVGRGGITTNFDL